MDNVLVRTKVPAPTLCQICPILAPALIQPMGSEADGEARLWRPKGCLMFVLCQRRCDGFFAEV